MEYFYFIIYNLSTAPSPPTPLPPLQRTLPPPPWSTFSRPFTLCTWDETEGEFTAFSENVQGPIIYSSGKEQAVAVGEYGFHNSRQALVLAVQLAS